MVVKTSKEISLSIDDILDIVLSDLSKSKDYKTPALIGPDDKITIDYSELPQGIKIIIN
jgi:hypothetical protein